MVTVGQNGEQEKGRSGGLREGSWVVTLFGFRKTLRIGAWRNSQFRVFAEVNGWLGRNTTVELWLCRRIATRDKAGEGGGGAKEPTELSLFFSTTHRSSRLRGHCDTVSNMHDRSHAYQPVTITLPLPALPAMARTRQLKTRNHSSCLERGGRTRNEVTDQ